MSDAQLPSPGQWPTTKISVPSLRTLTPRPQLRDTITKAVAAEEVIVVSAPGGSGKTSLLADWARHASVPVAWYALDAADRDTRRLLAGLCVAVERALPGAGEAALAVLDGGGKESAAVGLLLRGLEGRRLVLIVDDFQHLDDVPDAVPLWDHLLRHKSPLLSLVVLSRSMPLFGFATLVLGQQITGLGPEDLRFDEGEAATLLAAHGIEHIDTVPQMVRRSGGWAAGLLLLARTAPGTGKIDFLHARGEVLMEHLGREIIGSLPPDLRRFMLESAALGAASPQDADAVLGRSDSAAAYAEVAARGLFLECHDATYHYHDLFADCLVGVLRAEAPDRLRMVRHTAATRWIDGGDLPRGLATLAADEEWGTVAAVLERERKAVWRQGLWGTALAYAERLPDEYRTPRLVTLAGHARAQRGEHEQALVLADKAMAAASDDEEWLAPAVLRVHVLVSSGRGEEGVRSADAALAVAERIGHRAASMQLRELRGQGYLALGKVADGRNDLLVALAAYERDADVMGQARVVTNLATQLVESGRVREGEGYLMRARDLWLRVGDGPLLGYNSLTWALVRALDGDYAAARDEVDKALRLAREGGMALLECEAMAALADVHACSGRASEAEAAGLAAANLALRLDLRTALDVAFRARITAALLRRDRLGARRLIDEARQVAFGPIEDALLSMAEGTLALRMTSYKRAIDILEGAAARLEAANRSQDAARALLLSAEAAFVLGRVRRAEDDLNRMAGLILPLGCEGYLRPLTRWTPRVLAKRRELRRLRRDARLLLDSLEGRVPMLTLLKSGDQDNPAAPLPKVRISPFGVGLLEVDGQRVDLSVLSRRTREMLFYTVHLGRPVRRDEIIEAVFGGSLSKQTSQSLWDASRHMRRLFGEQAWRPHGGTYNLDCPIENEEHAFVKAVETALGSHPAPNRINAAHHAMSLFEDGGYLEWCDSPWAGGERARLTGLAIAVACALAGLYTEIGQVEDAVATCRRATGWDALAEEPQLALMQALNRLGDAGAALLTYHNYCNVLDQEGLEPSTGLVRLAASLKAMMKAQEVGVSKSRA